VETNESDKRKPTFTPQKTRRTNKKLLLEVLYLSNEDIDFMWNIHAPDNIELDLPPQHEDTTNRKHLKFRNCNPPPTERKLTPPHTPP